MSIKIWGNTMDIKNIFIGNKQVNSVYVGNNNIFSSRSSDLPIIINQDDLPDGAYQAEDGSIVFTKSVAWNIPLKYKAKFIDIFVVGGGGGGAYKEEDTTSSRSYGAGAGGYTNTIKSIELNNQELTFTIGAGSSSNYPGGNTYVYYNDTYIQANGAQMTGYGTTSGGSGGSGGGNGHSINYSNGCDGGQDGNNSPDGGRGQGTTTRAFGEEGNTLYAGGGGGGMASSQKVLTYREGYGGSGGGGNGGIVWYYSSKEPSMRAHAIPGIANTGGGGGGGARIKTYKEAHPAIGGSGVALIRLYIRRK